MSDDNKAISIRNTRTCGLNPSTKRNEEIYLTGDGRKFFASDVLVSKSDILDGTYLITKQVKSDSNIHSSRRHHANRPGVIQYSNRKRTMDFGAQKDTDSPYKYGCDENETLLDAWKTNSTYLSTSTGTTHELREAFILDIDDNYIPEHTGFGFADDTRDAIKSRVSAKISEIADAGLPLPSAVSINTRNGHYQLHWYLDKPVRKTSYRYDSKNDQCDEFSTETASGDGYILATHILNIMFGGDIGYTGWRCRNIYCTHIEQYANYKVCNNGWLEPVARDTEFRKCSTPELYASIFNTTADGTGDTHTEANWKDDCGWDTIRNKWNEYKSEAVALYETYTRKNEQCGDKKTDTTATAMASKAHTPKRICSIKSEIYGRDFKKIREIYSIDKVEAIYGAYANDHIGRNAYWIKSPKLIRLLEPDITRDEAFRVLKQAYGRLIDAGGGKLNGTHSSEPFTERDIARSFNCGWKYASSQEIYRGWTTEQRKRSAETNRTKYELRCLSLYNYLIYSKIDISKGVNRTIVNKLSKIFGLTTRTIRKMLGECSIETNTKQRYCLRNKGNINAKQAKSYLRLYSSVKAHLDKSNGGKDTIRRTFDHLVMEDDKDFCKKRNAFLCTVENAIAGEHNPKPTREEYDTYARNPYGCHIRATAVGHAPPDTR